MKFRPQDLIKHFEYFHKITQENNIWYAADRVTLLGAFRHAGFVPWAKKIQVMMTPESYAELKRLFPYNVIDSSIDDSYSSLTPSFVKERTSWEEETPFITIRIVVSSSAKKVQKFKNPLLTVVNKIKIRDNKNIKIAINDLYEKNYEGFYWISSRHASLNEVWTSKFNFDVVPKKFNTLTINVPVNSNRLLKQWYGHDYMVVTQPEVFYEYPAPLLKTKIDLRKETQY